MSYSVGQRVSHKDGYFGTVRYVGPVATSKTPDAIYIGVEWDVIGCGKNDGSVTTSDGQVHRYFTCASDAGSFCKAKLLLPGQDMRAALEAKYSTWHT